MKNDLGGRSLIVYVWLLSVCFVCDGNTDFSFIFPITIVVIMNVMAYEWWWLFRRHHVYALGNIITKSVIIRTIYCNMNNKLWFMSVTAFQCERDIMLFYRFNFEQHIAVFSAVHSIFNIVTDVWKKFKHI